MNNKLDLCKFLGVKEGEEFKINDIGLIYKVKNNTLFSKVPGASFSRSTLLINDFTNEDILIERLEVLTPEEKDYLESVIYPVRDKFITIMKISLTLHNDECLWIRVKYDDYVDDMYLYNFKSGTEYKGMLQEHPYTLKDLGLFQD